MFAVIKPLRTAGAVALAFSLSAAAIPAGAEVSLAPQVAVYDLSLDRSEDGSIAGASGRLAIQLTDTCEGYALTERLVLELAPADGEVSVLDSQFSSYEDRNGELYRYSSQLTVNGEPIDATEGVGRFENGLGRAEIAKPTPGTLDLPPGAMFPLRFTVAMIKAAQDGARSFEGVYFDGDGENPMVLASAQFLAETTGDNALKGHGRSWLTTIAFFALDAGSDAPIYQSNLRLYENGVADDMLLNYGSFAIRATLSDLEILPTGCE